MANGVPISFFFVEFVLLVLVKRIQKAHIVCVVGMLSFAQTRIEARANKAKRIKDELTSKADAPEVMIV